MCDKYGLYNGHRCDMGFNIASAAHNLIMQNHQKSDKFFLNC